MATTEAPPLRFRIGRRGVVHETRLGETMTAKCGQLADAGEPTGAAVSCMTCLGLRANRGSPRRRGAVRQRTELRVVDAALGQLEDANETAYNAWLTLTGLPRRNEWGHMPIAPASVYPAPSQAVWRLVIDLQRRHEGRLNLAVLATTLTAHEELLRLQSYLLP